MSKRTVVPKGESLRTTIDVREGTPIVTVEGNNVVVNQLEPQQPVQREKTCEELYPLEESQKLPKTRAEAIAAGSKRYFTGVACKHGHIAPRSVTSDGCAECARLNGRKTRTPEKKIEYRAATKAQQEVLSQLLNRYPTVLINVGEKDVTDRVAAAEQGLMYYYEAGPCRNGHTDKTRLTRSGMCSVCEQERGKRFRSKKDTRDVVIDNKNLSDTPTIIVRDR